MQIIETNNRTKVFSDVRVIPTTDATESAPSWLGTVLSGLLGLAFTLLTAYLVAGWTRSREEWRVRFDLRRALLEKELNACDLLIRICREMPNALKLEQAFEKVRVDFAPDSPVFEAYGTLRNSFHTSGRLNATDTDVFAECVKQRHRFLLSKSF